MVGNATPSGAGRGCHPAADFGCDVLSPVLRGTGQEEDKFLTAVTADEISGPDRGSAGFGEGLECLVPGPVAEFVVDGLEMVQVSKDYGCAGSCGLQAVELRGGHVQEGSPVEEAGQVVAVGPFLQSLDELVAGERRSC